MNVQFPVTVWEVIKGSLLARTCAICLNSLLSETCPLKCNHTFHFECINFWRQKSQTCPLCRMNIEPVGVVEFDDVLEEGTETHQDDGVRDATIMVYPEGYDPSLTTQEEFLFQPIGENYKDPEEFFDMMGPLQLFQTQTNQWLAARPKDGEDFNTMYWTIVDNSFIESFQLLHQLNSES